VFYEQGIGSMRRNAGNRKQEIEKQNVEKENIKFVVLSEWFAV
jgi:hypothetical protein